MIAIAQLGLLAGQATRLAAGLETANLGVQGGAPLAELPVGELRALLGGRLTLNSKTRSAFSQLTFQGLRGLHVLLASGVPPENFLKILRNRAVAAVGGADLILAQAAQLYDLEVEGFDSAFQRDPHYWFQVNYLAEMEHNVAGQLAEHREAARLAASEEVEGVLCSVQMPIDWRLLTPRKRQYIKRHVLGLFQGPRAGLIRMRYRHQHCAEVDLVARRSNGDMRLIEVKSTQNGTLIMDSNRLGFLILQGFRHSLLFEQRRFGGVELYLDADDVDRPILARLSEAAEVMEIPYSVSVGRGAARRQVIGRQQTLPRVPEEQIHPPPRPLPELPGST